MVDWKAKLFNPAQGLVEQHHTMPADAKCSCHQSAFVVCSLFLLPPLSPSVASPGLLHFLAVLAFLLNVFELTFPLSFVFKVIC